jgi:hypothetical protein
MPDYRWAESQQEDHDLNEHGTSEGGLRLEAALSALVLFITSFHVFEDAKLEQ